MGYIQSKLKIRLKVSQIRPKTWKVIKIIILKINAKLLHTKNKKK
jgi:hypothetical protein